MMVPAFEDKYIIGETSDGQCVKSRIWKNVQGQFTGSLVKSLSHQKPLQETQGHGSFHSSDEGGS